MKCSPLARVNSVIRFSKSLRDRAVRTTGHKSSVSLRVWDFMRGLGSFCYCSGVKEVTVTSFLGFLFRFGFFHQLVHHHVVNRHLPIAIALKENPLAVRG